eukprot:6148810-Prymnesium_polylepis.1
MCVLAEYESSVAALGGAAQSPSKAPLACLEDVHGPVSQVASSMRQSHLAEPWLDELHLIEMTFRERDINTSRRLNV